MAVSRESLILGNMGLLDLALTVWWLERGLAVEANPILAFYLSFGTWAFVLAKLLLVVGPLVGIEWVRRKHPVSVPRMMRAGIAAYAIFYLVGIFHLNGVAAVTQPLLDIVLR